MGVNIDKIIFLKNNIRDSIYLVKCKDINSVKKVLSNSEYLIRNVPVNVLPYNKTKVSSFLQSVPIINPPKSPSSSASNEDLLFPDSSKKILPQRTTSRCFHGKYIQLSNNSEYFNGKCQSCNRIQKFYVWKCIHCEKSLCKSCKEKEESEMQSMTNENCTHSAGYHTVGAINKSTNTPNEFYKGDCQVCSHQQTTAIWVCNLCDKRFCKRCKDKYITNGNVVLKNPD